jgi:hypothetical protein
MEWLLELVLVLLLALTLFHALRLERALGVLQRDRAALEELVVGFNTSTRQAEQGVERLRTAADGTGRQIARQVEAANGLKDDLVFLTERGERLADRLDGLVRAARPLAPDPARPGYPYPLAADDAAARHPGSQQPGSQHPVSQHPGSLGPPQALPPYSAPAYPPPTYSTPTPAEPEAPPPRLRSQAERDLLKALRAAR